MGRKVLLSSGLDAKLGRLTQIVQEVKGVLLYRPHGDYCLLEYMFMTGIGNEGQVQAAQGRLGIVNEFFKRNNQYHGVEFHTHSKGTIHQFGEYYADHFSDGDRISLNDKLRDDERYLHLLVTPKTKLLYGNDNPRLINIEDFPGSHHRTEAISQSIQNIAGNLGHDLDRFSATLR